jgi:hypothetical protein
VGGDDWSSGPRLAGRTVLPVPPDPQHPHQGTRPGYRPVSPWRPDATSNGIDAAGQSPLGWLRQIDEDCLKESGLV